MLGQGFIDKVNGGAFDPNAGPAKSKKDGVQGIQDRFLTLLVAQLNNQDPMNPMENAQVTSQMAQLSTVTGVEKLNENMARELSEMKNQMQAVQGVSMVGSVVTVPGNNMQVFEKKAEGGNKDVAEIGTQDLKDGENTNGATERWAVGDLQLPTGGAENVMVEIRDDQGRLLGTEYLGRLNEGRHSFEWSVPKEMDGKPLEFKSLNFKVVAESRDGGPINAQPLERALVSRVSFEGGALKLALSNGKQVSFDEVYSVS